MAFLAHSDLIILTTDAHLYGSYFQGVLLLLFIYLSSEPDHELPEEKTLTYSLFFP